MNGPDQNAESESSEKAQLRPTPTSMTQKAAPIAIASETPIGLITHTKASEDSILTDEDINLLYEINSEERQAYEE